MCDIYMHKCDHEGCNIKINMHLGDYSTSRDKIKVYCKAHFPFGKLGALWPHKTDEVIFVEPLTDNAKRNFRKNYSNE